MHTAEGLSTERRLPRWLRQEPYEAWRSAGELLEILHAVYDEYEGRPLLVPVSGGYDSRLLCSVAVAKGADVESWTTSPDDGTDTDIAFARAITRELGVRHRVITQDAAAYPGDALEVARRLEFMTPHHAWYAPFAKEVHGSGPRPDRRPGRRAAAEELHGQRCGPGGQDAAGALGRGAELALARRAVHAVPVRGGRGLDRAGRVREQFDASTSMLHGHRAELPLSVLHTRTVRGIARSAVNLVGPEASFAGPFIHPDFFDAALSVGVARKDKGRFYREVLHAANPRVAALPSTNVVKQPLQRVPLRSTAAPRPRLLPHDARQGRRACSLAAVGGPARGDLVRARRSHQVQRLERQVLGAGSRAVRRVADRLRERPHGACSAVLTGTENAG
ncbi:hypothetical protein [Nonomuraea dietziae]|uniref:hypothetical protein n=1 Tax=Nonomuraea dietziae TaxID=65515 RepID=UPI0031D6A0CC